jgi:hypothetical protein
MPSTTARPICCTGPEPVLALCHFRIQSLNRKTARTAHGPTNLPACLVACVPGLARPYKKLPMHHIDPHPSPTPPHQLMHGFRDKSLGACTTLHIEHAAMSLCMTDPASPQVPQTAASRQEELGRHT